MAVKLNLGSGRDRREGYVNADIRDLPEVEVILDVTSDVWPPAWDGCSEVVAFDLLEHLPFDKVPFFLSECFRVLKPGGVLNLRLPDLPKIMRRVIGGSLPWEEAVRLVHGEQSEAAGGIWGLHRHGYNATTIAGLLSEAGFVDIEVNGHPTEYNLYVTSRRPE